MRWNQYSNTPFLNVFFVVLITALEFNSKRGFLNTKNTRLLKLNFIIQKIIFGYIVNLMFFYNCHRRKRFIDKTIQN